MRADLAGDFTATPGEWALTGASLALDRARLSGEIRLRPATGRARARCWSRGSPRPRSNSTLAPDFAWGEIDGLDLDLSLEAQTVNRARAAVLSGEGGRIRAHLMRAGEAMRLERLEMRNIGGADLTASGRMGQGRSGPARRGAAEGGRSRAAGAGFCAALARRSGQGGGGACEKPVAGRSRRQGGRRRLTRSTERSARPGSRLPSLPGTGGKPPFRVELAAPEAGPLLNQLGVADGLGAEARPGAGFRARRSRTRCARAREMSRLPPISRACAPSFAAASPIRPPNPEIAGDATLSGDAGKMLAGFTAAPAAPVPLRLAARASWRDGALNAAEPRWRLWAGAKLSAIVVGRFGAGSRARCIATGCRRPRSPRSCLARRRRSRRARCGRACRSRR